MPACSQSRLLFYQEAGRQRLIEAERPLEALPYLVAARQATEATVTTPNSALRMLFVETETVLTMLWLPSDQPPPCSPIDPPARRFATGRTTSLFARGPSVACGGVWRHATNE